MERHSSTFQWSIFNRDRTQQFTVYSDNLDELVAAIEQLVSIIPGVDQSSVLKKTHRALESEKSGEDTAPESAAALSRADSEAKPVEAGTTPEAAQPRTDYCWDHQILMKLRTNKKTGEQWYDHRWKEKDPQSGQFVWKACNGKGTIRTTPRGDI